jgi:glycosyltransferase involved in cell wall biosynthesis
MKSLCVVMPGYHYTVHDFCNRLSSYYRLTLILPKKYCPEQIEGRKYDVCPLPSLYLFGELAISIGLLRVLRRLKPDVIITGEDFQPNSILIALFQGFIGSRFIVINEKYFLSRVNYLIPFHRMVQMLLTRPFVWRKACRILPRSQAAWRYAMRNGAPGPKMNVIPMGIETSRTTSLNRPSDDSVLELLSVGRLIVLKGYQYLIRALAELKNEGIVVRLTMVGEEYLKDWLRAIALRLGVETQIQFKGLIPHNELLDLYKEYDIYIQPSIVEVVGLAALEALASGRALIVSDVGGLADIVRNGGNGFRVPSANPHALADAIKILHHDRRLLVSMQKESLRMAEERFSWHRVISSYAATIDSCAKSRTREQTN